MSTNDSLIGKQLGDYIIQSLLGQGGMARVYRGYDAKLDRYAAVKVIEPNLIASDDEDEYRERFQREARAIAKLNHPNVVGVFQFGQVDASYYMAMVFVDGEDLRLILKDYNKRKESLPHAKILRITRDIAEALDYSHEQGVIHRDVKPSNIMVTGDGRSVLTDFGLALSAQEGTIGNTFGSVHYIAPEQAVSSAQAVPQSDLYSLGVVLYEMLTGRVPFEDVSAMSVALKHISDPPPLPSVLNPRISHQVEDVIIKALDKDPRKRYLTGRAFVLALESAFAMDDEEETHDLEPGELAKLPPSVIPPSPKMVTPILVPDDPPVTAKIEHAGPAPAPVGKVLPFTPLDSDDDRQEQSTSGLLIALSVIAIALLFVIILFAAGIFGGEDNKHGGVTGQTPDGSTEVAVSIDTEIPPTLTATAVPPTDTEIPPTLTATAVPPTDTEIPLTSTATAVPPTDTEIPLTSTATAVPPTDTEIPLTLTATAVPPTDTEIPPTLTATAVPPTDTEIPPTLTATGVPPTDTDVPATRIVTTRAASIVTATKVSPTNTGIPPTLTATSTNVPDITATPLITPVNQDEAQILLRYDGRTLVLFNRTVEDNLNIRNLTFVQETEEGEIVFEAEEWELGTGNLRAMLPNDCYQVWTVSWVDLPPDEFPSEICINRQGTFQTSRSFWVSAEPGPTFEVRRGSQVLAECSTAEVDIELEYRCVVDIRP